MVWFSLDGTEPDEAESREAGVAVSVAHAQERGRDAVGDLLEHAERVGASRIVVGVKHRSPVATTRLSSGGWCSIAQNGHPGSSGSTGRAGATYAIRCGVHSRSKPSKPSRGTPAGSTGGVSPS